MTDKEKHEIITEIRKEIHDELAIYVGTKVLKAAAKIIGLGVLALGYYLIQHGYIKL